MCYSNKNILKNYEIFCKERVGERETNRYREQKKRPRDKKRQAATNTDRQRQTKTIRIR